MGVEREQKRERRGGGERESARELEAECERERWKEREREIERERKREKTCSDALQSAIAIIYNSFWAQSAFRKNPAVFFLSPFNCLPSRFFSLATVKPLKADWSRAWKN